jgi:deoxyribonuclease IV
LKHFTSLYRQGTKSEIRIGLHVPISGGISNSIDNALEMDCGAFQIFSRNPRGWAAKPLQIYDVQNFKTKLKASKIRRDSIFVHMPYLPNLSSPNESLYEKSVTVLIEEVKRCSVLGIPYLVLHFGSNLGAGKDTGINQFVNACSTALERVSASYTSWSQGSTNIDRLKKEEFEQQESSNTVTILLENNVGHKNTIGSKFEDIRLILDKLNSYQNSIGICFDSCHAFAAGYDLKSADSVDSTLEQFDDIIGLKSLKLVHLNDSRAELGSNLDRHENLGRGRIGKEGIGSLCTHKSISSVPFIMETPREKHEEDMRTLRWLINRLKQ